MTMPMPVHVPSPIVVITPASTARAAHLERQHRFLDALGVGAEHRVVVWLDAQPPPPDLAARTVHVPPGRHGHRLATARNVGAAEAVRGGARVLLFLDVDVLPGPDLLPRYAEVIDAHRDALVCGPVTYLPQSTLPDRPADLPALTRPHPARPAPGGTAVECATAAQYDLFWSLSFAVTPQTWAGLGGFDERLEGYGGEDTDLGWRARDLGTPLLWAGGAHGYHQWHPSTSPPWDHLEDILRNGDLVARRHGRWPMEGWLQAFAAAGAIRWDGRTWRAVSKPG